MSPRNENSARQNFLNIFPVSEGVFLVHRYILYITSAQVIYQKRILVIYFSFILSLSLSVRRKSIQFIYHTLYIFVHYIYFISKSIEVKLYKYKPQRNIDMNVVLLHSKLSQEVNGNDQSLLLITLSAEPLYFSQTKRFQKMIKIWMECSPPRQAMLLPRSLPEANTGHLEKSSTEVRKYFSQWSS